MTIIIGAKVKFTLFISTLFTGQLFASDHILASRIDPIKDPAIGRVYYLERQSKFNDSKCYVESVMKVTKTEDEDEKIIKQQGYVFTTVNGARGATTDFYVYYPTNLDDFADTSAVYKMKLVPDLSKPDVSDSWRLYDRAKYDTVNPKNWIFKVSHANESQNSDQAKHERAEVYVENIDGLKEKIEKCIEERLKNARGAGGGGGSAPLEKKEEDEKDFQETFRTTFVNYNGSTYKDGKASSLAEKESEDIITFIHNKIKKASPYQKGLESILLKRLATPTATYLKARDQREKLLKDRQALIDSYSKQANISQLYALDLVISGEEAMIDSLGGSSLFVHDENDSSVASSASMIAKERLLDDVKKALKELNEKNKKVETKLQLCDEGYVKALNIATDGCHRIIRIEECNEDGECSIREEKSPVPNSCEVAVDLEKVLKGDLKNYREKFSKAEASPSTPLGEDYLKWFKVITETAKNVQSAVSEREYNWGEPLKECVNNDFEKTLLEDGLMFAEAKIEAEKKIEGLSGYVNLQIKLLEELSEKLSNSLAYDQSQVDKYLAQREKRIDNYKKVHKAYKQKEDKKEDKKK